VYAREMLAIIVVVAKFCHYLLGHQFVLRTDNQSLKELQAQTIQTPEQQAWLAKLLGYNFTIEYKKGCENTGADSLSRVFLSLTIVSSDILTQLQTKLQSYETQQDFSMTEINSGKL